MGSEMCIRDRGGCVSGDRPMHDYDTTYPPPDGGRPSGLVDLPLSCLLYTSDAADERSSVDLGGRRIIKKKTPHAHTRGAGVSR